MSSVRIFIARLLTSETRQTFLRSLSEAAAEGGSVAMAERIFANAYMVLGVGAKIIFYIVANFSAPVKAKWISLKRSFIG